MSYYQVLENPKIKLKDIELKNFIDYGLYQYPTNRAFAKIKSDEFVFEKTFREFTDFDGEIRTKTTLYLTYVTDKFAYGSQPHLDVTSCIATHVMPINKIDTGKLIFYDDNSIDFYYKKIMYQLIKEEPEQKYIDEWNEIKKNDFDFNKLFSFDMNKNNSVIFKNSLKSWHGVEKTTHDRLVLMTTYHKKNERCKFGD